jgi:hypothetical protein
MRDTMRRKQRTFYVNGHKVTIASKCATSVGNFRGWYVHINGERYFVNRLERQDAEDRAYVRWVNANVASESRDF